MLTRSSASQLSGPTSSSCACRRGRASRAWRGRGASSAALRRHEQRVDAIRELKLLLQPRERHERRADVALLRLQRELAELARRQHGAHRQPHRPPDIVLPAVQRLERDGRRPLDAEQHGVAGRGAELARERRAERRRRDRRAVRAARRRRRGTARIDRRRRRPARASPPAAGLLGGERLAARPAARRRRSRRERRIGRMSSASAVAEELRRHDRRVGPAEPLQRRDRAGCRAPSRRRAARRRAP